jgi:hypothetical protein
MKNRQSHQAPLRWSAGTTSTETLELPPNTVRLVNMVRESAAPVRSTALRLHNSAAPNLRTQIYGKHKVSMITCSPGNGLLKYSFCALQVILGYEVAVLK